MLFISPFLSLLLFPSSRLLFSHLSSALSPDTNYCKISLTSNNTSFYKAVSSDACICVPGKTIFFLTGAAVSENNIL
jgi:hypothetical protein